jgi:hypothetical protein
MGYQVEFVADDELPEAQDWVVGSTPAGWVAIFKRSRLTPIVLEEAWTAYRRMSGLDREHVPQPRQVPADPFQLGALVAMGRPHLSLAKNLRNDAIRQASGFHQ